MKRGAERQIQREDGEDPYAVDGETGSEGQPESEGGGRMIANRPIRGLPKKKATESPAPSFAQTPSPTPFTFAGFGTPQASTTSKPPSAPSNSLFSGFGSAPASSASTSSPLSPAATPFSFSAPVANGKPKTDVDSSDVDYYCTLRGLNISLRSQLADALAKQLDEDPFANLAQVLKAVQAKYEAFRQKAEEKRKAAPASTTAAPPTARSTPAAFSFTTPTAAAKAPPMPVEAASSSTSAVSTPAFAPPKPPTNGGFSFAGSAFTAKPTSQAPNSSNLLPGQPTFAVPSSGFFSTFGKNGDDEEEEDEEDDDDGKQVETNTTTTASAPALTSTSNPFSSSAVASPFFTTAATTSAFGTSSTPFTFGSAATTPTSPVANKAASNAYRFSFGGSKPDDTDKAKEQDAPPTQTPSLFSSSPAKTPSIGANFANTSGVKQPGAFSFGSSSINFGSSNSSSPSAFGSTIGSTGFTFGSSPTKDSTKKSGDAEDAS